jgi:hypothetical protein
MLLTMLKTWETVSFPVDGLRSVAPPETRQTAAVLPASADEAGTFTLLENLKRQAAEKTTRRKLEGRKPFDGLYGCLDCGCEGGMTEWRGEWANPWENSF